jgi:hypothetical protein
MMGRKYKNGKTSKMPCVRDTMVEKMAPTMVHTITKSQKT